MNLPILTSGTDPEEFQLLVEQARKASDLLKSLSHEVRLLILCLLSEGEKSVSELEDILTMPQAAVSQQLARLRSDGLVASRREGRMIFYSLTDSEVRDIIAALYDLFCKDARPDRD